MRVPNILAVIWFAIAGVAGWYIYHTRLALGLSGADFLQAELALVACLGAFISTTFVVWSYLQTNAVFLESQRPQLLIQVLSQKLAKSPTDPTLLPATFINYRNTTNNQFRDLNISVNVVAENRTYDLSDLFTPDMVMVGYDQRQRFFLPLERLMSMGIDTDKVASSGNTVTLHIGYSYTFNGVSESVEIQVYKWDPRLQYWIIE